MGFDNVKIDSCSEFRDLQLWEELLNKTGRAVRVCACEYACLPVAKAC